MPKPWRRDRPLTGAEIEEAIAGAIDDMETAAEDYERRAVAAASAETEYKRAKARLMLTSGHKTDAMREAYAVHHAGDLFEARNIAEALKDSQAERCRVARSTTEALRTLAASQRASETGRG